MGFYETREHTLVYYTPNVGATRIELPLSYKSSLFVLHVNDAEISFVLDLEKAAWCERRGMLEVDAYPAQMSVTVETNGRLEVSAKGATFSITFPNPEFGASLKRCMKNRACPEGCTSPTT